MYSGQICQHATSQHCRRRRVHILVVRTLFRTYCATGSPLGPTSSRGSFWFRYTRLLGPAADDVGTGAGGVGGDTGPEGAGSDSDSGSSVTGAGGVTAIEGGVSWIVVPPIERRDDEKNLLRDRLTLALRLRAARSSSRCASACTSTTERTGRNVRSLSSDSALRRRKNDIQRPQRACEQNERTSRRRR